MIWKEKTFWLSILGTVILFLWFGDKPVHLDETNFLALTSGEFWAPHSVLINWEGRTESAFDVLSNPPGLAWYLWIVRDSEVYIQRLWMLPWAVLSIAGVYSLAEAWGEKGREALLLWCVTPFFWVSANALMPDMALFALISCGMALVFRRKYLHVGAVLCGSSVLFRYSGLSMLPLLIAWGFFYRPKKWKSLLVILCLPTLFLLVHDLQVYGKWHFWHMISFQSETHSSKQFLGQLGACFAMVFGGFFWAFSTRLDNFKIWAVASVVTGTLIGLFGFFDAWALWHYGFFLMGFSLVGHAIGFYWHRKDYWFVLWILGGTFFLLNLRFMATRYWAPFILPLLLFLVAQRSFRQMYIPAGLGLLLSVALAWDDYSLAKTQKVLAEKVEQLRIDSGCEQALFAGHWGWQYYLESKNWKSIEEGEPVPEEACIAFSEVSWPQEIQSTCPETDVLDSEQVLLPIRIHSRRSRVNYHSNYLSTDPALMGFAPWGLGFDLWDRAHFSKACTRF